MIVRAITEAYDNVYKISAMKQIAADGDYFNFINSFPNLEEFKNPRLEYAFHILAANLAKKEGLTNDYRKHVKNAKIIEQSLK